MAISITHITGRSGKYAQIEWKGLNSLETEGEAYDLKEFVDNQVTIQNTFSTGTLTLQGSPDNVNWYTLKDTQGNDIIATANSTFLIGSVLKYIRPSLSGADGSDNIDVIIDLHK